MNNYEKIKNMKIKDMVNVMLMFKCSHCLTSLEQCKKEKPICKEVIRQWLQQESEGLE